MYETPAGYCPWSSTALSMTAYAGQTEEAKALYDQVQEKSNAITDMNASMISRLILAAP